MSAVRSASVRHLRSHRTSYRAQPWHTWGVLRFKNKINLDQLKKKQVLYITCNEESLKNDIKDNFIIKNNIMIELFPGTQFNEHIIELESS